MSQLGMPRAAAAALRGKIRQIGEGVARWSEHLPGVAKTRGAVERRVANARAQLQDSLDRAGESLARSTVGARREIEVLRRGLEAGLRAGTEAYRHKRGEK